MSAETDLLPSSVAAFTEALKGGRGSLDAWLEVNDEREVATHVEAYARACVSSATEALRAEVATAIGEAMRSRADVKEWQGAAEIYRGRAERLAEALRWYAENVALCRKLGSAGDEGRHALDFDGGRRARAALEQETTNG